MVIRPYVLATCAVLPLLAPEVWNGFRVGVADPVLGVLAPTEQPLSVRSPGGVWAVGLALAWFGLAYWQRRLPVAEGPRAGLAWWEAALVLVGGAAVLARLGNAWLYAGAMLLPLARQVHTAKLTATVWTTGLVVSVALTGLTLWTTRPPDLPAGAIQTAGTTQTQGKVLADWRWAPEVQRQLGATHPVLASGGLVSESADFWLDYVKVAQGHERWADLLRQYKIDLLILDAADQQRQVATFVRAAPDWRVIYDAGGWLVAQRATQ